MNRRLIVALASIFLVVWILGPVPASAEKVSITWLSSGKDVNVAAHMKLIEMFEEQNPGIEVKYQPAVGDWAPKVMAQMAAGNAPDLIWAIGDNFAQWVQRNQVLDLQPYFEMHFSVDDIEDFIPKQLEMFRMRRPGSIYAVPRYAGTTQIIYNRDLFEEMALEFPNRDTFTWDTMLTMAQKLTVKDSSGRVTRWGFMPRLAMDSLVAWLVQNGADFHLPEDNSVCTLDTSEAMETFEFIRDLMWKYEVAPKSGEIVAGGNRAMFSQGQVAMIEDNMLLAVYEDLVGPKFDWDVAELPFRKNRATMVTTDGYAIYRRTKHPDETFLLAKFLASPEAQQLAYDACGNPPASKSVLPYMLEGTVPGSRALDGRVRNVQAHINALDYSEPGRLFVQHGAFLDLFQSALDVSVQLNKEPVDKAFKNMVGEYAKVVAEFR